MNTKPTKSAQTLDEIAEETRKFDKEIEGFIKTGYDDTYITDSILTVYPEADRVSVLMRCRLIRIVMAHNPD